MGATIAAWFINPKNIAKLVLGIGGAILLWLAYSKIKSHFDHIKQIESENQALTDNNTKLEGQVDTLTGINKSNLDTYTAKLDNIRDNQQIAANEAAAGTARTQAYGDIRHAISNTASSDKPIGPATSLVVDRLWRQEGREGK